MQFRLEKRPDPSRLMLYAAPVAAVVLTMILGAIIFSILGYDGVGAVREIFISPLINTLKWQDLAVKATPLIIIAVGLSICYRANVWNIGAEGQYLVGAIAGTGIGILTNSMTGFWILPLMMIVSILGGMAYAAIPAFLRTQFKVNEILTSLMLTYVAVQLLNYLVFGPWKSPTSMGQAQTVLFSLDQSLPYLFRGYVVRWDFLVAILVAVIAWFVMSRSLFGFSVRVVGSAPHAARYGGFSEKRTIWLVLLVSGGLAGLAGILEATGPFGRLIPEFPQQYGFTAIIVAFLGRLHPLGVIIAALVLALTFVGGEVAQITVRLPEAGVFILQALVLFLLLSGDILVRYRLRVVSTERAKVEA
jgi:general nucleoside transport system permease protein